MERYGQTPANADRVAGKRPAGEGVRKAGGSGQPKRRANGESAGGSSSAAFGDRGDEAMGCEEEQSGAGQMQHSAAEQRSGHVTGSGSTEQGESMQVGAVSGGVQQREADTGDDRSGDGHDTVGGGVAAQQVTAVVDGGGAGSSTRTVRRRKRMGSSGAWAVRRFAAFAAGAREEDVVMVGGVHEFAGAKRTVDAVEERQVWQRDERGERRQRREQRSTVAARMVPVSDASRRAAEPTRNRGPGQVAGSSGVPGMYDSDESEDEFGGAGGWEAGGLGDRTGVG